MSHFVELVRGTPLQDCLAFWASCRQDGRAPTRQDIDPSLIAPRLLPHLFLYERLEDGLRCRLAGTGLRDFFGWDPTGRYLHEMVPDPASCESRARLLNRCIDEQLPIAYVAHASHPVRGWVRFRRMMLPLRPSRGHEAEIFGMVMADAPPQRGDGTAVGLSDVIEAAAAEPGELQALIGAAGGRG